MNTKYTIAVVGNPNCGKTTLFNRLTGSTQYVGNWPGVTVEKKEGILKGRSDVLMQDLPGVYSLSPYSLEEVVTRDYLVKESPQAVLNVIDASNLERNLYLTTQLLELGLPVLVALNMMDIVKKRGITIDEKALESVLGCPVCTISAAKNDGIDVLKNKINDLLKNGKKPVPTQFSPELESVISFVADLVKGNSLFTQPRWLSIKLIEKDKRVSQYLGLSEDVVKTIKSRVEEWENEEDDEAESLITGERYNWIASHMPKVLVRPSSSNGVHEMTTSDKIDKIITNRWLALPIFALVMWFVYYLSIQTVGTWGTDWVNDELFGEIIPNFVTSHLEAWQCQEWLINLVVDGIIAGVGAVLGFLPQMLVLFMCLALLEECGYLARVAFILDRIFRKFGLSGKSFIPLMVAQGCGVPAIMSSRTIENEKDRRLTIMITTFIPCSAKLPVIALIVGAFFEDSAWVAPSAYFMGLATIIISGLFLKKTFLFKGEPAPFVMELPAYHMPNSLSVINRMIERCSAFVKKAGTVIFVACVLVWTLSSFDFSFAAVETDQSMLASIGRIFAPLFQPLGWGDWRAAVATISGLIAKENIVGTMGVLFHGGDEISEDGAEIWSALRQSYTGISAYSFLLFNLLCAPCFAAMGAIRREMNSGKWTAIALIYQTLAAYILSFVVYQIAVVALGSASIGVGFILAVLIIIGVFGFILFKKNA